MSSNSYAQLIDDFEAGLLVIEGESLTDYISRMGGVDYDAKANGGIMGYAVGGKTKQAKNLLNKKAPKGEQLAYINSKEANLLKRMGGAGIDVNGTGIRSYMSLGNEQQMNENLSAAGGGPGGSQNQSSGDNDPYQQQIATNTAIAKSRNPTVIDSNDSFLNTIRQNVYNSPVKTKGIGRTLGYLLGNMFLPGIGGLLGGYLGGRKATNMANKFNVNKENLKEVPNIGPFYDFDNTTVPINKDISIINKDINNIDGQMAKVTKTQYNTLKSLGQVGNKGQTKGNVKELVPPGTFDSITDKEWEQIFRGDTRKQVVTGANGGLVSMFQQKR